MNTRPQELPVPAEPAPTPVRASLKRLLVGRMLAALWRKRRVPRQALRAATAERSDRRRGRIPPPVVRRKETLAVICIPSGPGDPARLMDTIDSVLASDGDSSQILVVDDCSVTAREAVVRERYPEVDFVRTPYPSGGLPNIWPPLRAGMEHALLHYRFSMFVKLDTDAIVTGAGFSERCVAALAAAPEAGIAGSFRVRADGRPEDHTYHASVIDREVRRDPHLARAVEQAEANGWRRGDAVQGGVSLYSRAACEALAREGWLDWRRPWHSNIAEDVAATVFVRACGLEALSVGAPDEGLLAVAVNGLPLPMEELSDGPWVAAHSTKVGLYGESEEQLRAFFRGRRLEWARGPVASGAPTR